MAHSGRGLRILKYLKGAYTGLGFRVEGLGLQFLNTVHEFGPYKGNIPIRPFK